tara:strand:- start:56 stop:373 length:318 start_codon:yes stop_codon:yes gene_type:complete
MNYFDEHTCMINSYKLLTGKASYDELLDDDANPPAFIFNPTKPVVSMEDDVYDVLIEYFEYDEDYEKCAELKEHKVLNSYYSLSSPLVSYKKGMKPFLSDGNELN